jgi:glycerol kinase
MARDHLLVIDQGTTSTRVVIYDARLRPVGQGQAEVPPTYPKPGWVEHDPKALVDSVGPLVTKALSEAKISADRLAGIGLTNQRETTVIWERKTGQAIGPALVWQDRRTAGFCEQNRDRRDWIAERTGLVLDPYFSATKIEWLLEHVEGLRERAREGRAVFGTIDSWLVFKLTGEHVTDASNASRTMLYDIGAGRWAPELLELFGVPARALPEVRGSAGVLGHTRPDALHGHAVPVAGVAGDQQAALFGQGCVDPGMGKNTYGTGSFVLLNSGFSAPAPAPGLLGTVAWEIGSPPRPARTYALEASIFVTGAAVQWLRDGLGIIAHAAESEALAASLQSNEQVYFVPAPTGLGSPHWDPHARGTIVGLTRGSGRAQLARAALEAIAYQTVDAVRALEAGAGEPLRELRADGGATANRWLMQFQADVLGVPVVLSEIAETTAQGAGRLAGVGVGLWTVSDVRDSWRERARFEPRMGEDERAGLLAGWADALTRARSV